MGIAIVFFTPKKPLTDSTTPLLHNLKQVAFKLSKLFFFLLLQAPNLRHLKLQPSTHMCLQVKWKFHETLLTFAIYSYNKHSFILFWFITFKIDFDLQFEKHGSKDSKSLEVEPPVTINTHLHWKLMQEIKWYFRHLIFAENWWWYKDQLTERERKHVWKNQDVKNKKDKLQ